MVYLGPIKSIKYPTIGMDIIIARETNIDSTLPIVALNFEGMNLWKYILAAGPGRVMKKVAVNKRNNATTQVLGNKINTATIAEIVALIMINFFSFFS